MGRAATVLEVASTSSPDKTYRVWVDSTGPIFCDCPRHKFHRGKPAGERPPCKHMRAIAGDATTLDLAQSLAAVKPRTAAEWGRAVISTTPAIARVVEVQEETTEGTWVTTVDLRRFTNLGG